MFRVLFALTALLPTVLFAAPGTRESALTALSALPSEELPRLAKIAACEGLPVPERWHFLIFTPGAENGLREYVVINHQIAVRRELTQFAEILTAQDVIGTDGVSVDSQKVGELAGQYARANRVTVASYNYELAREGPGLAPRWKIDCLDQGGRTVGSLVVNAAQGTVVSHEGFKKEPPAASTSRSTRTESPSRRRSESLANRRAQSEVPAEPALEPVADAPERPRRTRVRRAEPVTREPEGPLSRIVRGIFHD
jgi:hypothetical protein